MPLTTIDNKVALIVVDLQKGVLTLPAAHPVDQIITRSAELARAFRARTFPVVLVNVIGSAPGRTDASQSARTTGHSRPTPPPQWADLADELDPQPDDHRITKKTWGAFHNTSLHKELGVTQVFLTGVATSIGVESTARSAYEHGYHVVLVTDAMTDVDAQAHQHSVERIFPRLGETSTTEEVIALLKESAEVSEKKE
ncbi:isochorismatase family protein [Dictyobacter kobayashii]|uniref:Hydrolase n=1 Tax=Dictyobacter kobayashii TaxID=2014872 RepID=A0A402AP44_9CHLR|nr:isochorismatase family protein [Dictyobacter kobayashii]GCE20862.1 hydrolase [Dictyobacter kobayashii]